MMTKLPRIFLDRRFKIAASVTAIIGLVFITINIFVIGGDQFIFSFNSIINFPLAVINAAAAASVWKLMSAEKSNRVLWSGMLIGWASWALAETISAGYSLLGQVPYPSLADLFWVAGYIPMGIGLITRLRTMPTKPTRSQNIFIFSISAATILITFFLIFIPIIQNFDPQLLFESILNLVYPLFDLILVTIVWRLFFTYEKGDYGFGWRLLTFGFILNTASDFAFIYTESNGLYYPDMTANVISRLIVDVPYTVSYLMWFTGVYALGILLKKEERPVKPAVRVRVVRTYGHILVYTKSDDTVMDISPNFDRFFENVNVIGKSFADALTISEQNGNALLEKLRKEGSIADLPVQIRNRSGALQEMRLSGLAIINSQKIYLGSNLLLRTRVTDESFDNALDQPSKSMTKYLLDKSGNNNKAEIGQFLSDYYLSYIKSLLDLAVHEGGAAMSQALLDKLIETAKNRNWQMQFNSQTVLDNIDYPLETLREALPALLETTKQFVSAITDPAIVEFHIKEVSAQFSEAVHGDVARYEKAGSEVEFANHRKKTATSNNT